MIDHSIVVFSGGGTRGIAFAGALETLRKEGIDWGLRCPKLETVAGCSIGALMALLVALGFSAHEVAELVLTTQFHHLVNLEPMQMLRVATSGALGFDNGCVLQTFLAKQIARKTTFDVKTATKVTFAQLHEKTEMNLCVVATNLKTHNLQVFDKHSTPDVSVVDAVRASMALPPIFEPVQIGDEILCDGGLLNNFPVDLFDPTLVVGLRLASTMKTIAEIQSSSFPLLPFVNHVLRISALASDAAAWFALDANVRNTRVINIPCGNVSTFESDVNSVKDKLFKAGEESALSFLKGKPNDGKDENEWQTCIPPSVFKLISS